MSAPVTLSLEVHRACRSQLDAKVSQRIVTGRAIPYAAPTEVSDDGLTTYVEEWAHGVFRSALIPSNMGRVKLNYTHNDDTDLRYWVGRTLRLEEKADGLYGDWKVDDSPVGDAVLAKVADGQLPGMSVSAAIRANVMRGQVRVRTDAYLRHVALVEEPAFADALVLAVREQRQVPPAAIEEPQEVVSPGVPARLFLDRLRAQRARVDAARG